MLTIVTALPWEAERFAARLRGRRRAALGEGWAVWGERGRVQVRVVVSGPGMERAEQAAKGLAELDPAATGILATGFAGGLSEDVRPGHLVLATRSQHVRVAGGRAGPPLASDREFLAFAEQALRRAGVPWQSGDILSVDEALFTPGEKRRQHEQTRALVVQMEDYAWAQAAQDQGLPFVSVRAVLDPVSARLPKEVVRWDWRRRRSSEVAWSVARRPALAVALVRLAWQRRAAVRSIDRLLEALVAQR